MSDQTEGSQPFDNLIPFQTDVHKTAQEFGEILNHELLTILFTDLVDSTLLQSQVGNAESARLIEQHRNIVRQELSEYTAREIEWAGDSCLAVFSKPSDAIKFSLRIQSIHFQQRINEPNLPFVRIGIHIGEIVVKKSEAGGKRTEDLFGLQVSEASRIMSVASGNQIYCTKVVYDNARASLAGADIEGIGEYQWRNHGLYQLKGSNELFEICEVGEENIAPLAAPISSDKCWPSQRDEDLHQNSTIFNLSRQSILAASIALAATGIAAALLVSTGIISIGSSENGLSQDDSGGSSPQSTANNAVSRTYVGLSIQPVDPSIVLSPDGSSIIYPTRSDSGRSTQLAVQQLGRLGGEILDGSRGAMQMFLSPDGEQLGFYDSTEYRIERIPVAGGSSTTIAMGSGATDAEFGAIVAHWAANDIYYGFLGSPIQRVSSSGGAPVAVTNLQETAGSAHLAPFILPGDKGILFTSINGAGIQERDLYIQTGEEPATLLLNSAYSARYIPTGHIVFFREEVAMAVPFDLETLTINGEIVLVNEEGLTPSFAFSGDGTLAYFQATDANNTGINEISWVSMEGEVTPLSVAMKNYSRVRIGADGEYGVASADGDVWLLDLRRSVLQKLTNHPGEDRAAIFGQAGQSILFSSDRGSSRQIFQMESVNSIPQELTPGGPPRYPESWNPETQTIVFSQFTGDDTGFDIGLWQLGANNDASYEMVVQTPANEGNVVISPNGRWAAYTSDEEEEGQVYVSAFPSFEGKYQVSTDRGSEPVWAPDGSALYFRRFPEMMKVNVSAENEFRAETPEVLFRDPDLLASTTGSRMFDIHPDGDRFLMIKRSELSERVNLFNLVVVENWFENLRQIAPAFQQ